MTSSGRVKISVSVVLVALIVGIVVYTASRSSGLFRFVDEVLAQRKDLSGKELWMAGDLVPGSHEVRLTKDQGQQHRFELTHRGQKILVVYAGTLPSGAAPGRQLVVRGRLGSDDRFQAEEVRTKCPSKYKSEYEARR
jgi:cytochrome c-type biogenesis protein CcmE